jgi:hypothetical protein
MTLSIIYGRVINDFGCFVIVCPTHNHKTRTHHMLIRQQLASTLFRKNEAANQFIRLHDAHKKLILTGTLTQE